jgi:anion-transporting  ArsA/GET3 family ATPase
MKIQQIANDLVSIFHTQTPEQHLSIMNSLSKTFDHLERYNQILDKKKNDNENKLKYIAEELSIAREYSMVDSLVREQVEDLIKQQNKFTRYQQSIINMEMIVNEVLDRFHSLFIPDPERDKSQQLLKQLKKRGYYKYPKSETNPKLSVWIILF